MESPNLKEVVQKMSDKCRLIAGKMNAIKPDDDPHDIHKNLMDVYKSIEDAEDDLHMAKNLIGDMLIGGQRRGDLDDVGQGE